MGWGPTARVGTGLVDNLMNVSQQCVRVVKMTGSILGYMSEPVAGRLRSDYFISLFFWSILASSVQARHYCDGPARGRHGELGGVETITGKGRPSGVLYGCAVA